MQRQASIRRGGAVAIAAGSAVTSSLQMSRTSSSNGSIGADLQLQQQGSLAGERPHAAARDAGDLERLDSAAAAAAAVAATWMSMHTGDPGSLATSPTGRYSAVLPIGARTAVLPLGGGHTVPPAGE